MAPGECLESSPFFLGSKGGLSGGDVGRGGAWLGDCVVDDFKSSFCVP